MTVTLPIDVLCFILITYKMADFSAILYEYSDFGLNPFFLFIFRFTCYKFHVSGQLFVYLHAWSIFFFENYSTSGSKLRLKFHQVVAPLSAFILFVCSHATGRISQRIDFKFWQNIYISDRKKPIVFG